MRIIELGEGQWSPGLLQVRHYSKNGSAKEKSGRFKSELRSARKDVLRLPLLNHGFIDFILFSQLRSLFKEDQDEKNNDCNNSIDGDLH